MERVLNTIKRAADVLFDAEVILIGAGAGLSAAAGLDYTDEVAFAERFPGMLQYGFRRQYDLMGYPFQDEALKWGYLSVLLDHVYRTGVTQVYQTLRRIVGARDCFVITSNVDRYFHKNRFADAQIFTPQGDYERFQCYRRCHDATWDGKPLVEAMLVHVDRETQLVQDRSTLPVCPQCGGPVYMNVRGGDWFVDAPYMGKAGALRAWLDEAEERQLTVIDIGSGFNTPGVVRAPMESIGIGMPNAQLIRINTDHPEGPSGTISIQAPADEALNQLTTALSLRDDDRSE